MIHTPFQPSIVMDVSDAWERKLAAIAAHASQFDSKTAGPDADRIHPSFLETTAGRATFYDAMIGACRGEPFLLVTPSSLPGWPRFSQSTAGRRAGYRRHL